MELARERVLGSSEEITGIEKSMRREDIDTQFVFDYIEMWLKWKDIVVACKCV